MSSLSSLIESLGGLHDARVTSFTWLPTDKVLSLEFDDIFSNFEGLECYRGPKPGILRAVGVSSISTSLSGSEGHLNVYEMKVLQGPSPIFSVEITFWPSGLLKFRAEKVDLTEVQRSSSES
jgi:hypothetical protein